MLGKKSLDINLLFKNVPKSNLKKYFAALPLKLNLYLDAKSLALSTVMNSELPRVSRRLYDLS